MKNRSLPERLLGIVLRWMPSDQHDWARAMQAELEHIPRPLERWRFALGCARVALTMPGRRGLLLALAGGSGGYPASRPGVSALAGLLFLVPFACANLIVVYRLEPWFSLLRPGLHTSLQEKILLPVLLLLLPLGAFTALRPWLRGAGEGRRRWYPFNFAVATLLLLAFSLITVELASEIYACEFQQIPNCD